MATLDIAQGARSQLLHLRQTSGLGVPATGNYIKTRYNSHSLSLVKSAVESQEIRDDREVADVRHGNQNAQGDISFELLFNGHNTLLESAMFDAFVSNTDTDTLNIGTSPRYVSFEDGALDKGFYRQFYDMLCSRMTFTFRTGTEAIVRVASSWVGTSGGQVKHASVGGTPTGPSTSTPFDTFSGILSESTGLTTSAEISNVASCEITIDNGVAPVFGLGQQDAISVEYGRGRVTGTVTVFYSDHRWLDRFLDEEEQLLMISCYDPQGNRMSWRMDRIKFMDGAVPVDREQSRIVTLPFIALKDKNATPGSALQIIRDAA